MMTRLLAPLLLCVLVWTSCASLKQGDPGPTASRQAGPIVDVGTATVDITPEEPIRLSGYGSRKAPSEGVAQPLRASALAIGSDAQGPALLITVDLVGVPGSLTEYLAGRLAEQVRLPRERLVVLATHTHTGPVVKGTLPNIFGSALPPEHVPAIDRYADLLVARLEQVALAALAGRRPARLGWTQSHGRVTFAGNRRRIENGKWIGFGHNPEGPVDHAVPVLRVTDPDGSLRAVLVNYACHCTTLRPDTNELHGDWAGRTRELIEANHPGAVALVAIGAGADADPFPHGTMENVEEHARELAAEVNRLLTTAMRPLSGPPKGRVEYIDLPYERVPTVEEWARRAEAEGAEGFQARMVLDQLLRGHEVPVSLPYPIQTWAFGDDLAMVFLAGEVVVDYALRLKRELDADRLWVNAYANDLVCYIPSRRVLQEGGYEADRSMHYYDRPARLAAEVEDRIIEAVHRLLPDSFATKGQSRASR